LERICPQIAQLYGLKTEALNRMCIRLIRHINSPKPDSYIAVSYRWPEHSVPQSRSRVAFPPNFTPGLCKALLGELSQNEGIWIDALCIDQECKEEKLHTIPAMDLIYKKARLTVVVLSDICLDRAEKTLLRDLACIRPWLGRHKRSFDSERKLNQLIAQRYSNTGLPTDEHLTRSIEDDPTGFLARKRQYEEKYYKHPAFKSFVKKLLSAEWFTRAWCWHEFR
jgi:hypothetical protein